MCLVQYFHQSVALFLAAKDLRLDGGLRDGSDTTVPSAASRRLGQSLLMRKSGVTTGFTEIQKLFSFVWSSATPS